MTELTSPDAIVKWTFQDGASIVQSSQAMGDSVQTAFNNRQRYDFVWANSAARDAQIQMVQGSRGYQTDTKSEYIYDNSQWRLAVSYAEYETSGQSVANNTYVAITGWSLNAPKSTDSTFTSVTGQILTIQNPGVYAMSLTNNNTSGASGFSTITTDLAHLDWVSLNGYAQSVTTVTVPFFRVTASNTPFYLWVFQNSGGSVTLNSSILRVGRIA